MKVRYHSANFPRIFHPECAPGWQELEFDVYDLIHAAFTVGRANKWDVFQHGPYSYYEMVYRSAMVLANVGERTDGYLGKTPAYSTLDPSEKSAVSYFLGLTMTKLMADKLMDIPFLMHLEIYAEEIENVYGPITYRRGKSRPDLIAISRELNPHILEAKGRSGVFARDAFDKAKRQARMVVNVDGIQPVVHVGAEVYFTESGKLEFRWQDPIPSEDAYDYGFLRLGKMVEDYYRPFTDLIGVFPFDDIKIVEDERINLPELDISITIPKILIDNLKFKNEDRIDNENLKAVLSELPEPIKDNNNRSSIVRGNDGLTFEFGESWRERFRKIEI